MWTPIKDFEGLYSINKEGKVYSYRQKKVMKTYLHKLSGYVRIDFKKNGKKHRKLLHRLLAETFILNPENKKTVNHIDCNKQNNCLENLEWATVKENVQHAYKNGLTPPLRGEKNGMTKLNKEDVIEIRELDAQGIKSTDIAVKYNMDYSTVRKIIKGQLWAHIPLPPNNFYARQKNNRL